MLCRLGSQAARLLEAAADAHSVCIWFLLLHLSDETKDIIEVIEKKLADIEARLTNLVQKRSCDLQNAAANNHNTLNHVQRLLLVPAGARPGELVVTCTVTHAHVPAVCAFNAVWSGCWLGLCCMSLLLCQPPGVE
jgi:hypothetical protein